MITFNDILVLEGVDPPGVRLVKHQDVRKSLYDVWRTDPQMLERYQTIQRRNVFNVGETLATFVVTPHPRQETLFVGLFAVREVGKAAQGAVDPVFGNDVSGLFSYNVTRQPQLADYVGRLTIEWGPGHRAWHQRAAKNQKRVLSISDQIDPPFPGFDVFSCDVDAIDDLYVSWKEVLRNVKGVYLLVDKETGDAYVGSALSDESLWGRFSDYAQTGHGGNVELKARGRRPYRASVLQIGTFGEDILQAESAWKTKLMTRQFGLNGN